MNGVIMASNDTNSVDTDHKGPGPVRGGGLLGRVSMCLLNYLIYSSILRTPCLRVYEFSPFLRPAVSICVYVSNNNPGRDQRHILRMAEDGGGPAAPVLDAAAAAARHASAEVAKKKIKDRPKGIFANEEEFAAETKRQCAEIDGLRADHRAGLGPYNVNQFKPLQEAMESEIDEFLKLRAVAVAASKEVPERLIYGHPLAAFGAPGFQIARWKFWASHTSSLPLLAFAAKMLNGAVSHTIANERVHKFSKRISKGLRACSKLDTVERMTVAHEVLMDMLCAEVTTEAFRQAGMDDDAVEEFVERWLLGEGEADE